jgi:N4-gp56 family major capsid protein
MAQTKLSNLINPQVMADMIDAKLPCKVKFAPYATVDNTLVGQPGNTITVPKYSYIGDAEDVAEGIAAGTVVLSASSTQVTVKKAVKAVELTDESVLSGYGDPVGQAGLQIGQAIAQKVDVDCVAALGTASLTYDGSAAVISYAAIVNAVDKFAEEDGENKVLFIHPNQLTTLRLDSDFKDANKFPELVMVNGSIGKVAGCDVIVSNKVPTDATTYTNFIVKAGALTIYMKKGVELESDRDILAHTTVLSAAEHYAVALSDASKAVKFTTKKVI